MTQGQAGGTAMRAGERQDSAWTSIAATLDLRKGMKTASLERRRHGSGAAVEETSEGACGTVVSGSKKLNI